MICQNCKEETEQGKFCTSCGAALTDESAATTEPMESSEIVETEQIQETVEPNEPNQFMEQLKDTGANFGKFFLTHITRPSDASKANSANLISGIITMVLFSLIIALNIYIMFDFVLFYDSFVVPLLKNVILFGLVATITFAAAKVSIQDVSISDVIAKYGAYLIPFLLLYVVGILFSVVKLGFPFTLVTTISILGSILIIPILILTEKAIKGFDPVYIIIALSLVSYILYSYLAKLGSYGL